MWWREHQPQWGSPELRHSWQVVYCSQDSTGTRDTCKGTTRAQSCSRTAKPEQPQVPLRPSESRDTTANPRPEMNLFQHARIGIIGD